MSDEDHGHALVVGAGPGLGAALARRFAAAGMQVSLARRNVAALAPLCAETGARGYACDATDPLAVGMLFEEAERVAGPVTACVYNVGGRARGPLVELDPVEVERVLATNALGGFLVGQRAARSMLEAGGGAILFTGASASVKGYPQSAPFAMGKFALRGLAQSMARELAPQNVHVAHVVIDGGIRSASRRGEPGQPDALLDPDAIAETYFTLVRQSRSAWSWEIELRPWLERF